MVFIRKNIRFLFVFILPVYFYIVQNSIQNKHTHFYENGIVVSHSHPVDNATGKPINEHKHTKTEICLFQQISIDSFTPVNELIIETGDFFIARKFVIPEDEKHGCALILQPFKRGPPDTFHSFLKAA